MLSRMVSRLLLVLASILLPAQVLAQDGPTSLEGHWAFRIDDATIFVFALDQLEGGWDAAWTRPTRIESNGMVFRAMAGRETVQPMQIQQRAEVVELTFAGPEGMNRNDVLRLRQLDENRAELQYVGIPGAPYPLVRVAEGTPLGPFDEARIYDRDNAVTEEDFVAAEEPLEDLAEAEGRIDSGEVEGPPRIEADFLDGL